MSPTETLVVAHLNLSARGGELFPTHKLLVTGTPQVWQVLQALEHSVP